ncbi:PilZ domain-containing protein [Thiorhodococcus minor]|uniref:PilZ domain-containing protein n=1 Tax=Thiorhodococcus minor TaxID=57489 RepID=A0A6M0JZS1_9GAMM|nr:PilZ domain-containing protein [Thiorhodococcus minor]
MASRGNNILSSEELEYIQQLFAQPEQESEDEVGGWLRVSEDAAGLLEAFSESPRIELQAGWQGHRLRFPLKPRARMDTGEMTLEVGVPEILEGGERSRSWRVPLESEQEMRLVDQSGRLERPRVVNLSYTGMAIEQSAEHLPELDQPLTDLRLVLPGEAEFVRLLGYVVRHTRLDDKKVQLGIRFEPLEDETRDMLGRYILRRHKELQASTR